jgi:hypothetical protein
MKKSFTIFFALVFVLTSLRTQTILTVDNSPGSTANYTSLQAAINAAGEDDLIYVAASSGTGYGNITVNKKVNIIGPGYVLAANSCGVSNTSPAVISSLTVTTGANNCLISGLTTVGNTNSVLIQNTSNIIFNNNNIAGDLTIRNCSGVTVHNNFFDPDNFHNLVVENGSSNVIFCNNIFAFLFMGVDATSGASFINNIIFEFSIPFSGLHNSTFKNNIFVTSATFGPTSNTILFNVFTLSQNLVPPGNIGTTADAIFVGYPNQANYSPDGRYALKSNSPAIGAGEGGADCGIFGGADPYVLSGLPSIPIIYSVEAPSSAPAGGTIQVTVKAKTNQ